MSRITLVLLLGLLSLPVFSYDFPDHLTSESRERLSQCEFGEEELAEVIALGDQLHGSLTYPAGAWDLYNFVLKLPQDSRASMINAAVAAMGPDTSDVPDKYGYTGTGLNITAPHKLVALLENFDAEFHEEIAKLTFVDLVGLREEEVFNFVNVLKCVPHKNRLAFTKVFFPIPADIRYEINFKASLAAFLKLEEIQALMRL